MNIQRIFTAVLFAMFLPALTFAATKEELQKRFRARDPEIRKLKDAGVVGETSDGLVDFVNDKDPKAAGLVDQENADRRELYGLIAKETGTSADTVAKHNAQRNFEKAKKGDFLKVDGKWRKKA